MGTLREGMYPRGLVHKLYFLPVPLQPSLWSKYTTLLTTLSHHKCLLVRLVVIITLRLLKKKKFIMKLSNIHISRESSIINLIVFTTQFQN